MKMKNETAKEIELQLSRYFNYRRVLIVPNVSWGLISYEADILILSQKRYLYEVEIKVSAHDLKREANKKHNHGDSRIRRLYFAFPEKMKKFVSENADAYIPSGSGILFVENNGDVRLWQKPEERKAEPLNDSESFALARLGAIRIWNLKRKLLDNNKKKGTVL